MRTPGTQTVVRVSPNYFAVKVIRTNCLPVFKYYNTPSVSKHHHIKKTFTMRGVKAPRIIWRWKVSLTLHNSAIWFVDWGKYEVWVQKHRTVTKFRSTQMCWNTEKMKTTKRVIRNLTEIHISWQTHPWHEDKGTQRAKDDDQGVKGWIKNIFRKELLVDMGVSAYRRELTRVPKVM